MAPEYAVGLDFGTESVRALVVDTRDGRVAGQASGGYARGVIDQRLPGAAGAAGRLPPDYALQHPGDWLDAAARACGAALAGSGAAPAQVVGVGVDFTSCTVLPAKADGTPLCLTDRFAGVPLAWPELWKHHGAKAEADRINQAARDRKEPWLARYGGSIGLEWFFPKVLETLNGRPDVYEAADVWVEAGDWFVWQLVDGAFPHCSTGRLVRSTCQAGHKAMWSRADGYPSRAFMEAVHPGLADIVAAKMPGTLLAPGRRAGGLSGRAAGALGLRPGTPVSAAVIDAHAGVPGAGVGGAGTMVLVVGTSACHMLNADVERHVPGVAGSSGTGSCPASSATRRGRRPSATGSPGSSTRSAARTTTSRAAPRHCRRAAAASWRWTGSTAAARRSWTAV